jgi:hypothetical protein
MSIYQGISLAGILFEYGIGFDILRIEFLDSHQRNCNEISLFFFDISECLDYVIMSS